MVSEAWPVMHDVCRPVAHLCWHSTHISSVWEVRSSQTSQVGSVHGDIHLISRNLCGVSLAYVLIENRREERVLYMFVDVVYHRATHVAR